MLLFSFAGSYIRRTRCGRAVAGGPSCDTVPFDEKVADHQLRLRDLERWAGELFPVLSFREAWGRLFGAP
jgi:glycine/D-amino acid oxidase-like deaminating enzyme